MNVREAIQKYSEWGWNVIPLAEGAKTPVAGLTLQRYFTEKYPSTSISSNLNIGVITGAVSNLAIIDLDINDASVLNKYLQSFPTHRIQKSPHGYHLFYQHNPALPAIKKLENGDFFNGNHYVVLAPSKIGNLQYEWIDEGQLGTLSSNIFDVPEQSIQIQSGKYTRKEIYELINHALENGKPLEGSGNDTILYGSIVLASDGWNEAALMRLMKELNQARDNPESDKIVSSMVKRAIEYSKTYTKPEQQKQADQKTTSFEILSYAEMLDKYGSYDPKWLVDGWLPESSLIICSALPERYKTWLSVDLAISVASGLPFLNTFTVENSGTVLVVQQEDFGPEFISRFKTIERSKIAQAHIEITLTCDSGEYSYINPYNLGDKIFFHEDAELSFDNDASIQKLEQRIEEVQAKLCVIDPFYSLSVNDDYFAKTAAKIRQEIKRIRNNTGCTFFFVHHNRKSARSETGDNLSRDQIYGSTFVNAVMEGAWTVGRDNEMGEAEVLVYRRFKTKKIALPTKIKFHIDTNAEDDAKAYWLEVEEETDDNKALIIEYLTDNGATGFSELFEIFQHKFGSKSTFSKVIKGMIGHGITQEGNKGKYSVEPDTG